MKKKNIKIKSKTALNQVTLCWSVKKKIKTNSSLKLISGEEENVRKKIVMLVLQQENVFRII